MKPSATVIKRALYGLWLFSFSIALVQVLRNRGFWLDEAWIHNNLAEKGVIELLFGGPLSPPQQFPKIYLGLIAILESIAGSSTFWPRLLPCLFQLAGIMVWFIACFHLYWKGERSALACLAMAGLMVSSSYTLYYTYELKPYSADFFFSGLLFFLFATDAVGGASRVRGLALAIPLSLLFSYASLIVSAAVVVASLMDGERREELRQHRPSVILGATATVLLGAFLTLIDYRFGRSGVTAGILQSYWRPFSFRVRRQRSIFPMLSGLPRTRLSIGGKRTTDP